MPPKEMWTKTGRTMTWRAPPLDDPGMATRQAHLAQGDAEAEHLAPTHPGAPCARASDAGSSPQAEDSEGWSIFLPNSRGNWRHCPNRRPDNGDEPPTVDPHPDILLDETGLASMLADEVVDEVDLCCTRYMVPYIDTLRLVAVCVAKCGKWGP